MRKFNEFDSKTRTMTKLPAFILDDGKRCDWKIKKKNIRLMMRLKNKRIFNVIRKNYHVNKCNGSSRCVCVWQCENVNKIAFRETIDQVATQSIQTIIYVCVCIDCSVWFMLIFDCIQLRVVRLFANDHHHCRWCCVWVCDVAVEIILTFSLAVCLFTCLLFSILFCVFFSLSSLVL